MTFENIVAKGKIAHEQFPHFPQYFQLYPINIILFIDIFHNFSSTGQSPEELMPWHGVRRPCVHKQLLVNAIQSSVLIVSRSNLYSS